MVNLLIHKFFVNVLPQRQNILFSIYELLALSIASNLLSAFSLKAFSKSVLSLSRDSKIGCATAHSLCVDFHKLSVYNQESLIMDKSHVMKQNADFQEGISQAQSTVTPLLTPKFLTTNESFQMRYYIRILLKGHENCQG